MVDTAKVTLVTVIAAFELEERLVNDLRTLGAKSYTLGKVNGRGAQGHALAGLADAPNMRIEVLAKRPLAQKILDRIVSKYHDQPIMAYMHDVEAVPREHFD